MNALPDPRPDADEPRHVGEIRPLPGEAGIPDVEERVHRPMSRKGLLAVGLLLVSIISVAVFGLARLGSGADKAEDAGSRLAGNRPSAATAEPRRLELPPPQAAAPSTLRVPALVPTADELAEPIGVRRTGRPSPPGAITRPTSPDDAPVMLVSSRPGTPTGSAGLSRTDTPTSAEDAADPSSLPAPDPLAQTRQNLEAHQRQLQGLLNDLTRATTTAIGDASGSPAGGTPIGTRTTVGQPPLVGGIPSRGLFSGTLQGSATPRVTASRLGNRSLVLPKGTAFTCALKTQVISAASGFVGCQVQRNVFSDDGRVLLVERGSHLDGEYRIASVRPGTVRIPVLWTRIRTPYGVTVDIESPGTGALGESGIDGHVDNRWGERIGAAMLLSLIDDSVKLIIQNQASEGSADTIVLPSTTSNTGKLAEKVLDSTINIPPLIYRNQGGIVGIYVARDVDFSPVYELRPTALAAPAPDAGDPEDRP